MTQTKFQTHNRKTTQRPNHDAKQHNKNINRKNTRRPTTAKKKNSKQTNRTPRSRTLNQHKERHRQNFHLKTMEISSTEQTKPKLNIVKTDTDTHSHTATTHKTPKNETTQNTTVNPSSVGSPCPLLATPTQRDLSWSRHGVAETKPSLQGDQVKHEKHSHALKNL